MNASDQRFLSSRQADQRLSIALERYFLVEDLSASLRRQYAAYLQSRTFPALQLLLARKDTDLLIRFLDTGWTNQQTLRRALTAEGTPAELRLLIQTHLDDCFREPEKCLHHDPVTANAVPLPTASDILTFAQLRLFWQMPSLRLALSGFSMTAAPSGKRTGTDGSILYYNTDEVRSCFLEGRHCALYLHMVLHCLYSHLSIPGSVDPGIWDLACDISACWLADTRFSCPPSPHTSLRQRLYRQLPEDLPCGFAPALYQWLLTQPPLSEELLTDLCLDDHCYWYEQPAGAPPRPPRLSGAGAGFALPGTQRFGITPGSRTEELILQKEARYDFRSYLRRFTVSAEELRLDPDSFDYLPYCFGLSHYGNMPLVEPLEYRESVKVEELVIAIDTSGSCSLDTVSGFLAEIQRILMDREHFFKRMNVHIIQCDSMIQDHTVIHSREAWNRYLSQIRISGRGGTDFTPVFSLTEKLCADGSFRRLRGMLYFTDGDGIYPKKQPAWETAFVFPDQHFLSLPVPDWVHRLCLKAMPDTKGE